MSALAKRFWLRMGEKFGKRWIDERGMEPNKEWISLMSLYSEKIVMAAVESLPPPLRTHPPTEPEMAAHLRVVASKNPDTHNRANERQYWWSFVVNTLSGDGWLLGHWSMGTDIYQLGEPLRTKLRKIARRIFDSVIARTNTHNEHFLSEEVKKQSWEAMKALRDPPDDPTADRHP